MSNPQNATGTSATPPTAGAPPTQTTPPPTEPPTPAIVKMTYAEILNRANVLEEQKAVLEKQLAHVTNERDKANEVIEGQVRGELLKRARATTRLPETVLAKMSNDQLSNEVSVLERNSHGTPKSIVFAVDEPNQNEGLIDLWSERMKRRKE